MSRITEQERRALPRKDFAVPEKRAYPIPNEQHAQYALDELSHASMGDQARIRNAVRKRYPQVWDAHQASQGHPTKPATAPRIRTRDGAGHFKRPTRSSK